MDNNLPKTLSPSAALEVKKLLDEAEALLKKGERQGSLTRDERKQVDVKLARISAIKASGISDDDYQRHRADVLGHQIDADGSRAASAHEKVFRRFMSKASDDEIAAELRGSDFLAGTQAISYTEGPEGGFLVPASFSKNVATGLALVDPLLSPDVCSVITEPDFRLPPLQLPGWDLSTIAAVQVDENVINPTSSAPGLTQKMLNRFTYRLNLGASFEWEDDQRTFESAMQTMALAYGIGFARGIGSDLVNGNGITAPTGILNGLSATVTAANNGKLVLDDFTNVFFSVNAIYRAAPKCAWLMNDAAYKLARNAVDNSGRPLMDLQTGVPIILGKRVYVTPSLPNYNASLGQQNPGSFCVFGDLSHFYVHNTTLFLRRRLQAFGYVEYGKALYTGLMGADAILHDPTNGALPPIVAAALHE